LWWVAVGDWRTPIATEIMTPIVRGIQQQR
jgi:hypothetical protein